MPVGGCQKLFWPLWVRWPVILWPPSRLLWTDVHQRIKLLTQKAAVLADLVKKPRTSWAWSPRFISCVVRAG